MDRNQHIRITLLATAAAVLLLGCGKDTTEPIDLGHAYFPTQNGLWVEYQVDSAWRIVSTGVEGSISYRLREVILEDYTDPAGRPAKRLLRYVLGEDSVWAIRDVWSKYRGTTAAEKTEENVRLQKMVFPVRDNQFWDLNILNPERSLEVTYREVHVPWSTEGLSFDSTALVRQTVSPNLVDTIIHEERYAKHVGLVYKRWVQSNTQVGGTTGAYLTMRAVAYGYE